MPIFTPAKITKNLNTQVVSIGKTQDVKERRRVISG